jgi:hypothetical protein
MVPQSPGSPNRDSFGTPPWESRESKPGQFWDSTLGVPGVQTGTVLGLHLGSPGKKSHLDVASVQSCREYYKGGRWWLPPSSGRGESSESKCSWLVPTPKGVPEC